MGYEYPVSENAVDCLAEFTLGAICGTDSIKVGELPKTVPIAAVQATVEGRVDNWDDIPDNEYEILVERIQGAAEHRIDHH